MKQWLQEYLKNGMIPNYSLKECQTLLKVTQFDIQNYLLVCIGRKSDESRHVAFFRLQLLHHNHRKKLVHIYHNNCLSAPISIEIDSYSYLRNKVFEFKDRLSFERSTFVIAFHVPCLIRLKGLRGIFKNEPPMISYISPTIRERTYFQLQKMLEQMFTAYLRDLKDFHSVQKVIELLLQHITNDLSIMKSYLK